MNSNGKLFRILHHDISKLSFSTADDHTAIGSSSPLIGPNESVTTATIIRSGHLPTPRLGIIGEIEKAIKALARTPAVKERICEYIQQEVCGVLFSIIN